MARPASEEKRAAILKAATALVATSGTGASTAKIARKAGVAEGTVFTYFSTKEELLGALLLELEGALAAALLTDPLPGDCAREDMRQFWNRLIDWGAANPQQWRTLKRLKISSQVPDAIRAEGERLFDKAAAMLSRALAQQAGEGASIRYAGLIMNAIAEATFDAIAYDPSQSEALKERGFAVFWGGMAGLADLGREQ
ncbi:TetR/AcrR family transcriptional regulator [Martelella radicis]|uniref:AcrR family transcriptional regulator n=1 Tax=Martelella radicis TaxID=1397476 RepID=A0A7W6KNH6_9HYPH|nr:TetR/AcrR family transcriptional regulator [Martelella radicis]MBB4123110.1 AcrR family transcriptional regulator [Martelella radicis]